MGFSACDEGMGSRHSAFQKKPMAGGGGKSDHFYSCWKTNISTLLQRNGGSEHVISCQWDPCGAGSRQADKIKGVGTDEGTVLC